MLGSLPRVSDYVFSERGKAITQARLYELWRRIRADCGFGQMRLHDLRHSFASTAVNRGVGLRTIGGLLGHSDLSTTQGYAHLSETAVRCAADRVGKKLTSALDGPSTARRR